MRILIRVDASGSIGSGHLVRCRSLARALNTQGAEVRFCSRFLSGPWRYALESEFSVFTFPASASSSIDPKQGIWLPVTEVEDAKATLDCLAQQEGWQPDWVVVDQYGISSVWQQALRAAMPNLRIAVIDDLADRTHSPDLLVDHNIFGRATATRYDALLPVDKEISRCLGSQFALGPALRKRNRAELR